MKKAKLPDDPLGFLECNWPGKKNKKIIDTFARLKKLLAKQVEVSPIEIAKLAELQKRKEVKDICAEIPQGEPFSILDLIRQTCSALDLLFLGRQITYHIAASSELSSVFANTDQIRAVLSELLRRIVKNAPYGGRIDVSIKEVAMRHGHGVEVSFKSIDETSAGTGLTGFLQQLFGDGAEGGKSPLFACRETVIKQGGQLTVDLPKEKQPVFRLVLPTVGTLAVPAADQLTYKYDITIKNIANIRKRFGIKKSHGLVSQIENYVRSLVRHPIDIVMALHDKGIITAIYDTQQGMAPSVASRISQRLGLEKFCIGKKEVELSFSYHLSALPQSRLDLQSGGK